MIISIRTTESFVQVKKNNSRGIHSLACKRSQGRTPRHAQLNRVIADGFKAAGIPTQSEPAHLSLSDGKRPDGITLIPYSMGKSVVWDGTVHSTLYTSNIQETARTAGAAARKAERQKLNKYAVFQREYHVVPLAFETHGSLGPATERFLKELSKKIVKTTGDNRAGAFFQQRLCLAVQWGNGISLLGSMADTPVDVGEPALGY